MRQRLFVAVSIALSLVGCGGGSGGGSTATNAAPTARNISISDNNGGTVQVGDVLTGNYTYSDADGDAEGASTYRWLRSTTTAARVAAAATSFEAIPGATGRTYTVTENDIGKELKFEVTPVAVTGNTNGTPTADNPDGASSSIVVVTTTANPDPLAAQQWHLAKINTAGVHTCALNATTCRGDGILVGVLDDGLEIAHEDLQANVSPQKSRNFNISDSNDPAYYDPTPTAADSAHGTAVGGLIAAVGNNGKGVMGIAPNAKLAGFNILSTNTNGATSTSLGNKALFVSNNSWGPTDNFCVYQDSEGLNDTAIAEAVVGSVGNPAARDGKGAIVLFASGNGGGSCSNAQGVDTALRNAIGGDQASMDGPNNNRYVISVAALARDDANSKASYAEPGVNILVAAPAGNFCDGTTATLVTTDLSGERGSNKTGASNEVPGFADQMNYTSCMNGTSGATPVTAGVVTLMLQANPNLTWRDVRAILAKTATQNDSSDPAWQTNTVSNMKVHPYYGYGMVNAAAAVTSARTWVNLPAEKSLTEAPNQTLSPADNSESGASHIVTVISTEFDKLETVQVEMEFSHQRAGDIELILEHRNDDDSLISSEYLVKLNADNTSTAKSFTFTSSQHLYDKPQGKWVLKANDRYAGNTGSVTWKNIKFFGHSSN